MRALHLVLGSVALALAFAGLMLPLLPATPFALLASWSFTRSSPRLAAWLHRAPCIGAVLADWQALRAIRPRVRHVAWLAIALGVTLSLALGDLEPARVALLCSAAALGALVVARLPLLETAENTSAC